MKLAELGFFFNDNCNLGLSHSWVGHFRRLHPALEFIVRDIAQRQCRLFQRAWSIADAKSPGVRWRSRSSTARTRHSLKKAE